MLSIRVDTCVNIHNLYGSETDLACSRGKAFGSYPGGKIKCTLVQALGLCTGRTAHRGSRDIALPVHDDGTRMG